MPGIRHRTPPQTNRTENPTATAHQQKQNPAPRDVGRGVLHVVGACPGAVRAPEISRGLARSGHPVGVLLQARARHFVGPAAFAGPEDPGAGVRVVEEAPSGPSELAALLFAPASAATVACLARGLSPAPGLPSGWDPGVGGPPVFVAPDLDRATAAHPAVRENLALLRRDGVVVISGGDGETATSEEVLAAVLGGMGGRLSGRRVLVTLGGTREPIDSVRFLGNRSSGKMGRAIAREALRRGAEVSVVAANVAGPEAGVEWTGVETVQELREATLRLSAEADALVMAAAVSDFTPASPAGEKIRRGASEDRLSLELKATADVLGEVGRRYPDLFVVGFAATHGNPVADARKKLQSKGADFVVGNDISESGVGFEAEDNEVYIVWGERERHIRRTSKDEVARVVLDELAEGMGLAGGPTEKG